MLRMMKFDLVINPFREIGATIAGMLHVPRVLGRIMTKRGEYKVFGEYAGRFYYQLSRQKEVRIHSCERFSDSALQLARDLGITDEVDFIRKPEINIGHSEKAFADAFFKEHDLAPDEYVIGLQMSAMLSPARLWPFKKFAELVNRVCDRHAARIIILGTKKERDIFEKQFLPLLNNDVVIAAGKTSLLEAAAIIMKLDLMVTVDTGPMHIAAACNIPIVALFGRSSCIIEEARPYGDTHTILVENETKNISVDDVYKAVQSYIKKSVQASII